MLKQILQFIFKILFRIEVTGLENYAKAGNRVLIISNHVSFLDAVLLVLFLPEKLMFAINTHIANRWYVKPLLYFIEAFPLDPTNAMPTKSIIHEIRKGKKCMIFPEGRITLTGSLMKIYQGPALIAEKSGAKILPIHIDGAQRTYFSKLKGVQKRSLFPKIYINILEPQEFIANDDAHEELNARERRKQASAKLYDIMSTMQFKSAKCDKTLFNTLIESALNFGKNHVIAEDKERKPIHYRELLARSFVIGEKFKQISEEGEYVGVLLPNSLATIATFFGLQAFGRVPAMLNFSTGISNIQYACIMSGLKTVITARAFIEAGNLYHLVDAILEKDISIVYLEDLKKTIRINDKVCALFASFFPHFSQKYLYSIQEDLNQNKSNKPCVVLFTSGSEATPKGVVLSHKNILSNIEQARARIDFGAKDILFNVLPIFHSFGLTAGTLLPLLTGVRTFLYPSPLHYRIVPELVYDTSATLMFGTDTFLANYAKYAHPYDFYSIRYIFSGAEKLKESTRNMYAEKFGVRIFEGYGATETAPILSLNTPMNYKLGTVGRFLPSIKYSIEKVDGIDNGGKLLVEGDNIMLGYLRVDKPAFIQKLPDNIYDTGDIVDIDDEGYISILGRVKRFAKIGGEMVSLTAVEEMVQRLWSNSENAVITINDEKKGEALILLTTHKKANREELLAYIRSQGLSELYIPKRIEVLEKIPLLGTGKVDYVELKKQVH